MLGAQTVLLDDLNLVSRFGGQMTTLFCVSPSAINYMGFLELISGHIACMTGIFTQWAILPTSV